MAKYSLCIEAVLDGEVDFYDRIQVAKDLGFDAVTSFGCYLGRNYAELYGDTELSVYDGILMGK